MSRLLDELRTPEKLSRLVLAPSFKKGEFDSHTVDCPFLFRHEGRCYMTYVGWDTVGYQTGLASSADLVHWTKEGMILGRGPKGSPTEFNAALTCILRDNELHGPGTLKKVNGRFAGTYHAYPNEGLESGPAAIGICTSDDLRHWDVAPPVLHAQDGTEWEHGGLYKSWLMEHDGAYHLFYNAKNQPGWPWIEQTGVATSRDLRRWERHPGNPVIKVGPRGAFDDTFVSDPCVLRHRGAWVMFFFTNSSDGHARDSVAFSDDLLHWTKSSEILIDVGPPGSIDAVHAHKPGIIAKDGRLYHFYCAASRPADPRQGEIEYGETRGIALAVGGGAGKGTG